MPASTWRRASFRTPASSSAPLVVNGVTSAVPTPVNVDLMSSPQNVGRSFRAAQSAGATAPAYSSLPIINEVVHRVPAAAARDPPRGFERAVSEDGAVADRVCERNGLRRRIEADLVGSGNEAGAR